MKTHRHHSRTFEMRESFRDHVLIIDIRSTVYNLEIYISRMYLHENMGNWK